MSYRTSFSVCARRVIVPVPVPGSRRCCGEYPAQSGGAYGTSAISAARLATSSAVMVSVPSGRCGPCCSRLPIGTSTMSEWARNHCRSGGARSNRLCDGGRVGCGSGMSVLLCDREVACGDDLGESAIVDAGVDPLEGDARAQPCLERGEESSIRLGKPERVALGVGKRKPPGRRDDRDGSTPAVGTLGDDASKPPPLVRVAPDDRDHAVSE